jgi:4-hydroxybenzoate polyprenyltransferase
MKKTDIIWEEFIYGGHWGSIAASAIALATTLILDIKESWEFLLIVYLGTQCIYRYNHSTELEKDKKSNSPRTNHLNKSSKNHTIITVFYAILFLTLLIYFGDKPSIFFGGFLLILGLFFTYKSKTFTKKIIGFKSFYVAFSWSLLPIFTTIYYSYPLNLNVILFALFVFLRLIIDASFYDLKDIKTDKSQGLVTLAMSFKNKNNFLNFLHILNIISFIPLLYGIIYQIFPLYSIFLILLFFYSSGYIQKAKSENADILSLSYILVDGEYYYWPFLLFLGLKFIT